MTHPHRRKRRRYSRRSKVKHPPDDGVRQRVTRFGKVHDFRVCKDVHTFEVSSETLKANFGFFDTMLSNDNFMETQRREVHLNDHVTSAALSVILKLTHEGFLRIQPNDVIELLPAADYLQLKVRPLVLSLHLFYLNISVHNWRGFYRVLRSSAFDLAGNFKYVLDCWMNDNIKLIKPYVRAIGERVTLSERNSPGELTSYQGPELMYLLQFYSYNYLHKPDIVENIFVPTVVKLPSKPLYGGVDVTVPTKRVPSAVKRINSFLGARNR